MAQQKTALITGITGQDGSYLAELLLEKGYVVYGIIRRSSTFNTDRIDHIFQDPHERKLRLILKYADVTDASSVAQLIQEIKPDEIYHLAAQSHVRVSFDIPEYTAQSTAIGSLNILEAIRKYSPHSKFYQASSSEMFGKVQEIPQTEKTPFYPRSPYGVSKVFAYWMTINYRESYGIFACNGILFNHECISENTPLLVRDKKTRALSFQRIKDLRRAREKGANIQQWLLKTTEIWDGDAFVDILCITATRRKKEDDNFHCKTMNTRHGVVEVTNHHNMLSQEATKIKAKEIDVGNKLLHKEFPSENAISTLSKEEALFLGLMAGDGYVSEHGKGQFTNSDTKILTLASSLWRTIALGNHTVKKYTTEYGHATQLMLLGNGRYLRFLRDEIYTFDGFKKVPDRVLNANEETKIAFLRGYNLTDGLKANPCTYEFKNFKTNSPLLAQGLLFLIKTTTMQEFNITFEEDEQHYGYYSMNLLSPTNQEEKEEKVQELLAQGCGQREIERETGISRDFIRNIQSGGHAQLLHHLSKQKEEVKKIFYHQKQPTWVYDIETSSGKFMAGVGTIVIANSPRRGATFVTRKITRAAAEVFVGKERVLYLGNLDAKRDWGYSPDYVEAQWRILQQEKPDDFVIATGETHSVREFCEAAYSEIGIKIRWEGMGENEKGYDRETGKLLIAVDPHYYRPAEVDLLVGSAEKAREKLGWEATVRYRELVKIMVDADVKAFKDGTQYKFR